MRSSLLGRLGIDHFGHLPDPEGAVLDQQLGCLGGVVIGQGSPVGACSSLGDDPFRIAPAISNLSPLPDCSSVASTCPRSNIGGVPLSRLTSMTEKEARLLLAKLTGRCALMTS